VITSACLSAGYSSGDRIIGWSVHNIAGHAHLLGNQFIARVLVHRALESSAAGAAESSLAWSAAECRVQ
jgi:hypothetical protein